ncbi:MAG: hypothetical protein M3Q64_00690 [bacterium]|nr:hypothetical protein [bacterium]
MTIPQLILGTFFGQLLLMLTKLFFINYLNIENVIIRYGMWAIIIIISIAIIRRMGTLNYLEAFFITIVWTITALLVDFALTSSFTGREVYKTWYFWLNYLMMILAIVIFHRKTHVQIRNMHTK